MELGEHCSAPDCRQLDFLPFECDCCHLVFCLEHRTYSSHRCTSSAGKDSTVIVCPLCATSIRLLPGKDPNLLWDEHTRAGGQCDPSKYKKPVCPVTGCKEKLTFSNRTACKTCGKTVCLKHRYADAHECRPPAGARPAGAPGAVSNAQFLARFDRTAASAAPPPQRPRPAPQPTRPAAPPDPNNTVIGTAVRRAQQSNEALQLRPEVCQQCRARFATVMELIHHTEAYHPAPPPVQAAPPPRATGGAGATSLEVCPQCQRRFPDVMSLIDHVQTAHESGGAQRGAGKAAESCTVH